MSLTAKKLSYFPPPHLANQQGLVFVSDEISTEILLEAYSFGIFPWPKPGLPIPWISPDPRGVLDFEDLHIPRSLKKSMSKTNYQITENSCFLQVIKACAKTPRPRQKDTWITNQIIKKYQQFHKDGHAHSVECWMEDRLVGGLYGVYVAGVFSGESMFHWESNTSKYCLIHLIEKLKSMGHTWMDIQMVTESLSTFGGKYIPRKIYLDRLKVLRENSHPHWESIPRVKKHTRYLQLGALDLDES